MKSFEIHTPLSKKDVYLTLKHYTSENLYNRPFKGFIDENSFIISRCKRFSNNILNPKIIGSFAETEKGTELSLQLRLSVPDRVGICLSLLFYCAVFIFSLANAIASGIFMGPVVILVAGICMFLLGYFIFNINTKKSVKLLKEHLSK